MNPKTREMVNLGLPQTSGHCRERYFICLHSGGSTVLGETYEDSLTSFERKDANVLATGCVVHI